MENNQTKMEKAASALDVQLTIAPPEVHHEIYQEASYVNDSTELDQASNNEETKDKIKKPANETNHLGLPTTSGQYSGLISLSDCVQVHIDLRHPKKTNGGKQVDAAKKSIIRHINAQMRAIWIEDKNRRYGLLVKKDGDSSYEQWIVKPRKFTPEYLLEGYSYKLILDKKDLEDFVEANNLGVSITSKHTFWTELPQNNEPAIEEAVLEQMKQLKMEIKTETAEKEIKEAKMEIKTETTEKEAKEAKTEIETVTTENETKTKIDYDSLIFIWVNEDACIKYYIFKLKCNK